MNRLARCIPLVLLILTVVVIGCTVYHRAILSEDRRSDFLMLYAAGQAVRSGQDVYRVHVPRAGPYYYPPTTATLMAGFTVLPIGAAVLVWYGASWAALLWAGRRLVQLGDESAGRPVGVLVVGAFLVNFGPVVDGLHRGQMSAVLFALMVEAFWQYRNGRAWGCGAWVAVAASLKAYPALMILPLLVRREWRGIGCFLLVLVVLLLALPGAVMGPEVAVERLGHWVTRILLPFFSDPSFGTQSEFAGFSQFGFANQSLYACLVRYLADSALPAHRKFALTLADWPAEAVRHLAGALSLLLVGMMAAIAWRKPSADERRGLREALVWCLPIVATSFISHVAWHNYYTSATMMYALLATALVIRHHRADQLTEPDRSAPERARLDTNGRNGPVVRRRPNALAWVLGLAVVTNWLHFAFNFCRQAGLLLTGTLALWVALWVMACRRAGFHQHRDLGAVEASVPVPGPSPTGDPR